MEVIEAVSHALQAFREVQRPFEVPQAVRQGFLISDKTKTLDQTSLTDATKVGGDISVGMFPQYLTYLGFVEKKLTGFDSARLWIIADQFGLLWKDLIWYWIGSKRKIILEHRPKVLSWDTEKRATELCNVDILVGSKCTLTLCLERFSTLHKYDREMIEVPLVPVLFPSLEAINDLHDEAIVNSAERCVSVDCSLGGQEALYLR